MSLIWIEVDSRIWGRDEYESGAGPYFHGKLKDPWVNFRKELVTVSIRTRRKWMQSLEIVCCYLIVISKVEITLWLGSMSRCLWMKCTLIVLSSLVDCDKNLKVFLLVLQIVSDDKMCINCIFILLFRRRFNNGIFHTWESSILCNCEKNSFYKKTIDKIND